MRRLSVIGLAVFFIIYPAIVWSANFLAVFNDGREVRVDVYGYQGDKIILHQGGRTWQVDKSRIRTIKRLSPVSKSADKPEEDHDQKARMVRHDLGGLEFVTYERGYVSSLGRVLPEEEITWFEDLLLQTRGDPCDSSSPSRGFSLGWVEPPDLSILGASDRGRIAVENAATELNAALAASKFKIKIIENNDETADITVRFAPRGNFRSGEAGGRFRSDGRCFVQRNGPSDPVIKSARIWIATDIPAGEGLGFLNPAQRIAAREILLQKRWQEIVLHELVHALGFSHSAVFEDSAMFCRRLDGQAKRNGRTFLSLRDKKALEFFINHVRPGDGPNELREKIRRYWLNDN